VSVQLNFKCISSSENNKKSLNLLSKAGLKNITLNNLEKLEKFEIENRSLAYRVANKPSLYLALGEKKHEYPADLNNLSKNTSSVD